MARISRVGLGWAVEDRVDWYQSAEEWYATEAGTDYGSLIEGIAKGDCTQNATGTDFLLANIHGAWLYADPSVYYDFTNQDVIPFIAEDVVIGGAYDVRISGIYIRTTGASAGFAALGTNNTRALIEDCRIESVNPNGTGYAVDIKGAGSQANQDVLLRCVISRVSTSNTNWLIKQSEASGYGAIRACVLDAKSGGYVDGSNNAGLEVTDCVGLGSVGYDGSSLILNTSSSEDTSGSAGLTSIDNTALTNYATNDFRSVRNGALDVTGTLSAFIGVELDGVAVDEITLTPFSSTGRYIFNRELNDSDRTINVSVSLTGDPSGGIQWRLVNNATGLPITGYDWGVFLASPASGGHSVPVNVPTSYGKIWYKLELRFTTNNLITASSVLEFAVGAIVVDNGQSNSEYRDTNSLSPPTINPDASYCTTAGWQPTFSTGNGAIAKANALIALLNVPVGYFNNGAAGQALWNFVTGLRWDSLTGVINNHFDNYFELMSFDQGETDARTAVTTATYQSGCQTLLDNILTQMSRPAAEFNFAMCLGGNSNGYNPGAYTDSSLEEIRNAKRNFVAANVSATMTHRLDFPLSDSIHHGPATYELIAAREITEYSAVLGLSTSNIRRIVTGSIDGNQLTLNYSSGDALSKVGTGASTITEVSSDSFSTLIAITATVVNTDSVVHTLASTPAGEVDIREYYGIDIDVTTRPDLIFPSSVTTTVVIISTLNLLSTGTPDGSYTADIYNNATKTLVESKSLTFTGGGSSTTLSVNVGTETWTLIEGSNAPTTGMAYIGVTE